MTIRFADHLRAVGFSVCAVLSQASRPLAFAQTDVPLELQLLGKAQTLESRGRLDLATPVWQQVLLMDPRSTEALGGLVRAARQQGNEHVAQGYLAQLHAVSPAESPVVQIPMAPSMRNPALLLGAAGNLARAGEPARAMALYRQLYGENPPVGTPALAYYETEAATTEGRSHSIAGLRALSRRFPDDSRYPVALGRILVADSQTRAEGRGLLEAHANDPEARAALQQKYAADHTSEAATAYPQSFVVPRSMAHAKSSISTHLGTQAMLAPKAAVRQRAGHVTEMQAAYKALNEQFLLTAEVGFEGVLKKAPRSWQALAGLGYVRLRQRNFPGAISYLEQAKTYGGYGTGLENALEEARFRATLQMAVAALKRNEFPAAQQVFAAALEQRPGAPEALRGLGGTLLQAQQNEAAIEVFREYAQAHPADPTAWHGLFVAQAGAGHNSEALATENRIPPATRNDLMLDPRFLLALAMVDTATGNTSEAQAVLDAGLDLPFPEGGRGLTPDLQAQYAALLVAAGRPTAAMVLYRQVLAADAGNTAAWMGLVTVEHGTGRTEAAVATLQQLPVSVRVVAMRDPSFVTVVASLRAAQGHEEQARAALETLLSHEAAANYHLFVPAQLQLAGLYVRNGELPRALPIYHEIQRKQPGRLDAHRQLIEVLHATGHDTEAIAQLKQLTPEVRAKLEANPAFLELAGDTYAGAGQPQRALPYLLRAEAEVQAEGATPAAGLQLQIASMQYVTHNDAELSRQLTALEDRSDLTGTQRARMQSVWAEWAVRRAVAEAHAGDPQGAAKVLNTALEAFSSNTEVARTIAEGFVAAGLARNAEAIFQARDMANAPLADFQAAITAAMAANDHKLAEVWLHVALKKYPNEPQLLLLASRYEDERGHEKRAKVYLQASLDATSAPLAQAELARELGGMEGEISRADSGVDEAKPGLAGMANPRDTQAGMPGLSIEVAPASMAPSVTAGPAEVAKVQNGQSSSGRAGARLRDFAQ
ncbi:MAG: tetratricopeptide repeat protein [Janthinobacterium lividum]